MQAKDPIIFSTHSAHKLAEVQALLQGRAIQFLSLKDIGYHKEIPEPFETLEENARVKADTIFKEKGMPVFSEDTGLFIQALGGKPGVYSARYAGEPSNSEANIDKVLHELQTVTHREAYFKTVICFRTKEQTYFFEGVCNGSIALQRNGVGGFGYDPIFIPDGFKQTFAELPAAKKNDISHRGKAFHQFAHFLETYTANA